MEDKTDNSYEKVKIKLKHVRFYLDIINESKPYRILAVMQNGKKLTKTFNKLAKSMDEYLECISKGGD